MVQNQKENAEKRMKSAWRETDATGKVAAARTVLIALCKCTYKCLISEFPTF